MSKFEVGQVVECVSAYQCEYLSVGKMYKVISNEFGKLTVLNDKGQQFSYDRCLFKLPHNYPNPPHKHKDLIIAWANGADIQYIECEGNWRDIVGDPLWARGLSYRIKPNKSNKDIQIEELEAKASELLAKIKELKESK